MSKMSDLDITVRETVKGLVKDEIKSELRKMVKTIFVATGFFAISLLLFFASNRFFQSGTIGLDSLLGIIMVLSGIGFFLFGFGLLAAEFLDD